MKTIDRIILWILGLGFPIVIGLMIWAYSIVGNNSTMNIGETGHYTGGLWDYLGVFFILWMILAISTLFRLLVNANLRETILSSVARIKERDEREVEISGHAAKFSFFANLALLVCLLFFSSISFTLNKYKHDYLDEKGATKHGRFEMGISLRGYDKEAVKTTNNEEIRELKYNDLPISKSGIIILLIVWQVGMYHLSARKKSRLV